MIYMIRNKYSAKAKIPRSIIPDAKPKWYNLWPLWITAIATLLYFVATVLMWCTMKGTLDQTKNQVNIQKEEISNRLRPMVYPALTNESSQLIIDNVINFDFKNYGPIAANEVRTSIAITNSRFKKVDLITQRGMFGIIPPGDFISNPKTLYPHVFEKEVFLYYAVWYKSMADAEKVFFLRGVYSLRKGNNNCCEYYPIGSFEESYRGLIKDTVSVDFGKIMFNKNIK